MNLPTICKTCLMKDKTLIIKLSCSLFYLLAVSKLETCGHALDVFENLKKMGVIGEKDIGFLLECFDHMQRADLKKKMVFPNIVVSGSLSNFR